MNRFQAKLAEHGLSLTRQPLVTLQLNVGRKCNQACRHCHVDAAPWRTEMLTADVAKQLESWIQSHRPTVVDITGGAPELSPYFRSLVQTARGVGSRVIDRNNLTILQEPGFEDLHTFLAANQVEVVASLPCYLESNVNRQRGNGVFARSIAALQLLNRVGYGTDLPLTLVYNPLGAKLPPDQKELEADYKEILWKDYGIQFTQLFTLTNQPIARFAEDLRRSGEFETYLELLAQSFNPSTVEGLMCRNTLSVDYQGRLYDCDFNQMLEMGLAAPGNPFLWEITPDRWLSTPIRTGEHCLACTAGAGSSCGGALQTQNAASPQTVGE